MIPPKRVSKGLSGRGRAVRLSHRHSVPLYQFANMSRVSGDAVGFMSFQEALTAYRHVNPSARKPFELKPTGHSVTDVDKLGNLFERVDHGAGQTVKESSHRGVSAKTVDEDHEPVQTTSSTKPNGKHETMVLSKKKSSQPNAAHAAPLESSSAEASSPDEAEDVVEETKPKHRGGTSGILHTVNNSFVLQLLVAGILTAIAIKGGEYLLSKGFVDGIRR